MAEDAAGTDDGDESGPASPVTDSDADTPTEEPSRVDDRERTSDDDRRERTDDATDRFGSIAHESTDDEYRIPLDLSGGDEPETDDADPDADDPYAPEPSSTPIEAGTPDLENVIFVFLGAVAMGLVLYRVVTLPL